MWKGVIGVEVVVATVLALPLVRALEVLGAKEELVEAAAEAVEELVLVVAVEGGAVVVVVHFCSVVVVAVVGALVAPLEDTGAVLAGEGRMGRP